MNKFIIVCVLIIIIICVVVTVSISRNEKFGLYADTSLLGTPIFTPNAFKTEKNQTTEETQYKAELLHKWLAWISQIENEHVREGIYSFCPNLQPNETISEYGYTERMSYTLDRILPQIEFIDPKSIKNNEDIQRVFKDCIKISAEEIGVFNSSHFQPKLKEYNYVV